MLASVFLWGEWPTAAEGAGLLLAACALPLLSAQRAGSRPLPNPRPARRPPRSAPLPAPRSATAPPPAPRPSPFLAAPAGNSRDSPGARRLALASLTVLVSGAGLLAAKAFAESGTTGTATGLCPVHLCRGDAPGVPGLAWRARFRQPLPGLRAGDGGGTLSRPGRGEGIGRRLRGPSLALGIVVGTVNIAQIWALLAALVEVPGVLAFPALGGRGSGPGRPGSPTVVAGACGPGQGRGLAWRCWRVSWGTLAEARPRTARGWLRRPGCPPGPLPGESVHHRGPPAPGAAASRSRRTQVGGGGAGEAIAFPAGSDLPGLVASHPVHGHRPGEGEGGGAGGGQRGGQALGRGGRSWPEGSAALEYADLDEAVRWSLSDFRSRRSTVNREAPGTIAQGLDDDLPGDASGAAHGVVGQGDPGSCSRTRKLAVERLAAPGSAAPRPGGGPARSGAKWGRCPACWAPRVGRRGHPGRRPGRATRAHPGRRPARGWAAPGESPQGRRRG